MPGTSDNKMEHPCNRSRQKSLIRDVDASIIMLPSDTAEWCGSYMVKILYWGPSWFSSVPQKLISDSYKLRIRFSFMRGLRWIWRLNQVSHFSPSYPPTLLSSTTSVTHPSPSAPYSSFPSSSPPCFPLETVRARGSVRHAY